MIELEGVPELIDPVMVAAFEGWNDAGDAASTAVGHMDREFKGEVFAALDAAWVAELQREWHFHVWDERESVVRWMTAFDTTTEDVDTFIASVRAVAEAGQPVH